MVPAKRLMAVALATAVSVGSFGAPAIAATSKHWTTTQCKTWEAAFVKRNPHASKARKAEANKVLKGQGCSARVK